MISLEENPQATRLHQKLVDRWKWRKLPVLKSTWASDYRKYTALPGERLVRSRIYGQPVWMNEGNTTVLLQTQYPDFNRPILSAFLAAYHAKGRPLVCVDVGAAIGDTGLLLAGNHPDKVATLVCLDGDDTFSALQKKNLEHLGARYVQGVSMLSDKPEAIPSLVKEYNRTGHASGEQKTQATTLDLMLERLNVPAVDFIKVDVDGFDLRVLAGGRRTLAESRPVVIFEWFPNLCYETGNDPVAGLRLFAELGYSRFAWFKNTGQFSHFAPSNDEAGFAQMAAWCQAQARTTGTHFDIVAIPDGMSLDVQKLALMEEAQWPL